jgi:hypothetical protein
MDLQQTFTVPVPVDHAWAALLDPQRIARCMPGASVHLWRTKPSPGTVPGCLCLHEPVAA